MRISLRVVLILICATFLTGCFGIVSSGITSGDNIALVEVKGLIVEPDEVIQDLEKARKKNEYKAVVVRVDSPGGSVAASQEIFRMIKDVNEEKPVVISMGDVAASGGYYVSAGAKKIFANEGTVTGSIGVRLELMNAKQLFELMRLEPETLKSGKFKDLGSIYRALTPEERKFLEDFLNELHTQFKIDIASARSLEMDYVNEIGDGRIFTGLKAKEMGLIDEIGGLMDAKRAAMEMTGLKGEPKLIKIRKGKPWWISILEEQAGFLLKELGLNIFNHRYFLYEWRI